MNKSTTTAPPKGYKKTAIGTIPEDWEVKKLFEICNFTNGKGHEQIIDTSGKYILVNSKFVSTQGEIFKTIDTNLCPLKKNDITIVMSDVPDGKAIAKCFYVDKDDLYSLNQRVGNIRVKSIANSKFIYYQLDRNKYYLKFDDGIKQTNLRKDEVLNCPIFFPPILEQQKIAEIISTWDDAITNSKTTINTLKDRNKGLAQQLLTGKKRLGGFTDKWKKTQLGNIINRVTSKNEELNDTVVTISAQRGFVLQEDFFNKRVASDTLSGYYLINKGQFAYNKSYSNGYPMGAFKRLNDFEKAVVTTLYICFELKENICSDYMVHFFENGFMTNNLMKIAKEGGRAHGLLNIGLEDFMSLELTIPSIEEQNAIAQVLETATQELKSYQDKLEALQLQKKGLMQQLLTGKIRVNVK